MAMQATGPSGGQTTQTSPFATSRPLLDIGPQLQPILHPQAQQLQLQQQMQQPQQLQQLPVLPVPAPVLAVDANAAQMGDVGSPQGTLLMSLLQQRALMQKRTFGVRAQLIAVTQQLVALGTSASSWGPAAGGPPKAELQAALTQQQRRLQAELQRDELAVNVIEQQLQQLAQSPPQQTARLWQAQAAAGSSSVPMAASSSLPGQSASPRSKKTR